MSPAASRRYVVGFAAWIVYETVVLATSKDDAIAKGKALYNTNGLGDFVASEGDQEPWHAQSLDQEAAS